jgi:hypothetical protein
VPTLGKKAAALDLTEVVKDLKREFSFLSRESGEDGMESFVREDTEVFRKHARCISRVF